MKLLLLASLLAAALAKTEHELLISTKDIQWADSDGYFYALVIGYDGTVADSGHLDNTHRDDFEKGDTNDFKFTSDVDVGEIACLVMRAGNQSKDAWVIDNFKITSSTDTGGITGANPNNVWLSGERGEGKMAMIWCKTD